MTGLGGLSILAGEAQFSFIGQAPNAVPDGK